AADRDRDAEVIIQRAVAGGEFLLLGPDRAAAGEDVGSTLVIVRADGFIRCAHYHSVAADRDRFAEAIIRSAIAGGEFPLQHPDRAAAGEDVGSTLIIVRADGFIRCAHYHSVAADRDRSSVETSRSGIAGGEFLLQRPDRAAARK